MKKGRCYHVAKKFIIVVLSLAVACGSVLQVKNGTEAFQYKKYAVAIDMLEAELKEGDDLNKRLLLARSYDATGKHDKALSEYARVAAVTDNVNILLEYGRMLKTTQNYDKASEVFKMLKTEALLDPVLDREIASAELSMDWIENPDTLIKIQSLPANSEYNDFAPSWIDGHLVFTSDRVIDPKQEIYDWTGYSFSNLWQCSAGGGDLQMWSSSINTELNEGSAVLHPNGKDVYFTRCTDRGDSDVFCHIYSGTRDEYGEWDEIQPIENVNGPFNSRHPTFSTDGTIMFYSSNQNSAFGYDIYYSVKNEEGWQPGIPLPQMINTERDEVFPYLYKDTLYFSSDGWVGMGGLDLYKSFFDQNDQWVRPINLGYPMNSGGDDFAIFIDTLNRAAGIRQLGYFSSNRIGGSGGDDIYTYKILTPKPAKKDKRQTPWTLTVKVLEPVYRETGNPNSGIRKYSPVNGSELTISDTTLSTDITGMYSIDVDSTEVVQISASKEGYLKSSMQIDISEEAKDQQVFARLILQPIFYGTEINLDQIYYDFNRWEIREDAKPSLDTLISVLKNNPNIRINLASHTDCRGEDDFNQELSQKRAESAVQYLIRNGIDGDRLIAVGKGEKQPAVYCECDQCTEEEHQINRRTTFEILK